MRRRQHHISAAAGPAVAAIVDGDRQSVVIDSRGTIWAVEICISDISQLGELGVYLTDRAGEVQAGGITGRGIPDDAEMTVCHIERDGQIAVEGVDIVDHVTGQVENGIFVHCFVTGRRGSNRIVVVV